MTRRCLRLMVQLTLSVLVGCPVGFGADRPNIVVMLIVRFRLSLTVRETLNDNR
jgi:hypothetical protein